MKTPDYYSHFLNLFMWMLSPVNADRESVAKSANYVLRKYPEFKYSGVAFRATSFSAEKLFQYMEDKETTLRKLSVYSFTTSQKQAQQFFDMRGKKSSASLSRMPNKVLIKKNVQGLDLEKCLLGLAMKISGEFEDQFGESPAYGIEGKPQSVDAVAKAFFKPGPVFKAHKINREICPRIPNVRSPLTKVTDFFGEKEIIVKRPIKLKASDAMRIILDKSTNRLYENTTKANPEFSEGFPPVLVR